MSSQSSTAMRRLLLAATFLDLLIITLFLLALYMSGAVGDLSVRVPSNGVLRYDEAPMIFWILMFVFLLLVYQLITELACGGWTIGKAVFGLEAAAQGVAPPPFAVRARRLGLRAMAVSMWRESRDGVAAHDHMLGISYRSPILNAIAAPARDRDWVFRILNGKRRGQLVQASRFERFNRSGTIRVGRDPRWADLIISDDGVSRQHAILVADGRKMEAADLGSRNGTTVNGRKIPANVKAECGNPGRLSFGGVEVEVLRHRSEKGGR